MSRGGKRRRSARAPRTLFFHSSRGPSPFPLDNKSLCLLPWSPARHCVTSRQANPSLSRPCLDRSRGVASGLAGWRAHERAMQHAFERRSSRRSTLVSIPPKVTARRVRSFTNILRYRNSRATGNRTLAGFGLLGRRTNERCSLSYDRTSHACPRDWRSERVSSCPAALVGIARVSVASR